MVALYNAGLKPLQAGVSTQPYQHATKLFLADNFRLVPKQQFLYYVIFNFDPGIYAVRSGLGTILSFAEKYQSFETGMLVKRTDLPKFQINTKTVNAYNRKNILQTGITYETLNVTFHDDAADVITNFWNDYYTYYFRDSDYTIDQYRNPYRYNLRNTVGWGFSPRNRSIPSFFSNIRIFSLHNKRFTEYMLINPVITSWKHGELDSKESTGLLENGMGISFETVKYFTGFINPVNVDGFSLLHYDNKPSPISTSVTNIYSDSGILGAIDGVAKDLSKPDGTDGSGGVLNSLLSMYRAYNNIKNINLKNVVGSTLGQIGSSLLNTVVNGASQYLFPNLNLNSIVQNQAQIPTFIARSITGGATAFGVGQAVQTANTNGVAPAVRGFSRNPINTSTPTVSIRDVPGNSGEIIKVSGSQQVSTGITTAYYLDDQGNTISEFQSRSTTGKYDPASPSDNVRWVQTTYDSEGTPVTEIRYVDGTQRIEDADGNVLQIVPGNNQVSRVDVDPTSTAARAASGQTVPRTAIQTQQVSGNRTQVVGGIQPALVQSRGTNVVAGAIGGTAGVATALAVGGLLKQTGLNNSAVGRAVGTAISATTGAYVGKAITTGLNPILDKATKDIKQVFTPIGEKISNVVGSWTGSGGFDPKNPLSNIVGSTSDGAGGTIFKYKDGTTRTVDAEGVQTVVKGTDNQGIEEFFRGVPGQNSDIVGAGNYPGASLTDSQGNPILTGWGGGWNSSTAVIEDPLLDADLFTQATPFGGSVFGGILGGL